MASVLHGSARTTPRIRAELQASKESARSLAARYDLNPKTVRKWRQRTTTADAPMGPKAPKSTVLTPAEEAIVVAFRQKTLLPLDDVLGCLRDTHSQSQPERPTPLPPAAWDLQAAEGRGQRQAQPVQELPDRLCPHRQLRTATHRRQAGHVPGDRPGLEIHLRRVPQQRRKEGGRSFFEKCRGRLPLQNPHRANR